MPLRGGQEQAPSLQWHSHNQQFIQLLSKADKHKSFIKNSYHLARFWAGDRKKGHLAVSLLGEIRN